MILHRITIVGRKLSVRFVDDRFKNPVDGIVTPEELLDYELFQRVLLIQRGLLFVVPECEQPNVERAREAWKIELQQVLEDSANAGVLFAEDIAARGAA